MTSPLEPLGQCCCSTDRSKAVVRVLVLLFVAFVVYSTRRFVVCLSVCVILFLCFSVLLVLKRDEELILVLFVRLFSLCLFRFVGFLFLLVSGKGCGL